jgi:Uma2 family endonuclease
MLTQAALAQKKLVTADEFELIADRPENSDRLFELVNGEIIEKRPTEQHGTVVGNLIFALKVYAKMHKPGRVGAEVRYRLPQDRANARMPDISYSSVRRPLVKTGGVPELPELAVEIKSPTDSIKRLREKADYYIANGVKLVWLVYPDQRMVEVYRPAADVEILFGSDTLSGYDVLPSFTLTLAEVFADPFDE